MPHDVIMPALGMAQETGRIIAWLKKPGDAVRAGEPLMEVETDKATVEVEAQTAGFLTDLRADAGTDVPVGEVIAVIVREKPEASAARIGEEGPDAAAGARPGSGGRAGGEDAAAAADGADPEPPGQPVAKPSSGDAPLLRPVPSAADGRRVLASPLARRLAAERGLDLARLAAGRSGPIHAADLDALGHSAAEDAAGRDAATATATPAAASTPMHVAAVAPAAELDALIAWAATQDAPLTSSRALAAFAAAALREATGHDGPLALRLARPSRPASTLADPDRGPLSADPGPTEAEPHLILRDLSGSPLTSQSAAGTAPTLTVVRRGGTFALRLDHDAGRLDPDAAAALLAGFAARVDDPLRHLL